MPELSDSDALWQSADRFARAGDWVPAVDAWDRLLQPDETPAAVGVRSLVDLETTIEARFRRGLALLGMREPSRAALDFHAARLLAESLGVRPLVPLLLLGLALEQQGEAKHAESVFEELLELSGPADRPGLWAASVYSSLLRLPRFQDFDAAAVVELTRRARRFSDERMVRLLAGHLLVDFVRQRDLPAGERAVVLTELSTLAQELYRSSPADPVVIDLLSRTYEVRGEIGRAPRSSPQNSCTSPAARFHSLQKKETQPCFSRLGAAHVLAIAATSAAIAGSPGPHGYLEVHGRVMADSCVNDIGATFQVELTPDGRHLYYGAEPGGNSLDIWRARYDDVLETFVECEAVSQLNSAAWDAPSSFSADGKAIWISTTRLHEPRVSALVLLSVDRSRFW